MLRLGGGGTIKGVESAMKESGHWGVNLNRLLGLWPLSPFTSWTPEGE